MAKPKNSIAINGAKYFIFKNSDGVWIGDPLVKQAIHTRTFIPIGREYKMTDTPELMINILKTDNVILDEEQLSADTIKEFDKADLPYTKIAEKI